MKEAPVLLALLFIVGACAPTGEGSSFDWDGLNYVEFTCKNSSQPGCLGREATLMAMTRGK